MLTKYDVQPLRTSSLACIADSTLGRPAAAGALATGLEME